ncbi:MAG: inorganic phosphate transporter [Candidatus Cloacimonetes bacterium]|nr:inorganic phosphate transporter [Candidatus Cloacimonadota bacterium]
MIFIYLLSGLFLGWSLGANDTGNIFGAAVETRMLKFKHAALIAAIFITLGAMAEGSGPSQTLGRLGSVDALGGAFTVALAAAAAITLMVRIRIPVSTSQTIVGAIIGWNFFSGRLTDFRALLTIAMSWITAFVMSAAIAGILFQIFRRKINKSHLHLLELDVYTRYGLILIGAFAAYSLGANNIANVVGVFVPGRPFKDLRLGAELIFSGTAQLYLVGAMAIVLGIYTYSWKLMRTVGKDLFHLSPVTALIALLSEAIVLFVFASQALRNLLIFLHLPAIPLVPVSSSQVIVGAVMGIAISKGGKNIRYNILAKISLAWVIAPLMAFFFSFIALFTIQNVFEQDVKKDLTYEFNSQTVGYLVAREMDKSALSIVNGRSFDSEQKLYSELKSTQVFTPEEISSIIRIVEVYPLKVNTKILTDQGAINRISDQQLRELQTLEDLSFRHKWDFQQHLSQSESWRLIPNPQTEEEKLHNQKREEQYELLYRLFYYHPKR